MFRSKKGHPHEHLGMGLIQQYALIVPLEELDAWLNQGWIEAPHIYDVHYAPKPGETVILGRPKTLLDVDKSLMLGCLINNYQPWCGSYGVGGPGFIGFTLVPPADANSYLSIENTLIYAVWGLPNTR